MEQRAETTYSQRHYLLAAFAMLGVTICGFFGFSTLPVGGGSWHALAFLVAIASGAFGLARWWRPSKWALILTIILFLVAMVLDVVASPPGMM